jgi:hypothetical protein
VDLVVDDFVFELVQIAVERALAEFWVKLEQTDQGIGKFPRKILPISSPHCAQEVESCVKRGSPAQNKFKVF